MNLFRDLKSSLLHFAFPHVCEGCGIDLPRTDLMLCLHCLSLLPETNFHLHSNNPIEKLFWGRISVRHATSQYYFTKGSMVQHLTHQFKYKGNKDLGFYLGKLMGHHLLDSNRFLYVDALIPLPLFNSRERKRGYNQSLILCHGIASIINKPVFNHVIERNSFTETQTKKARIERWQNMEGRFSLKETKHMEGKNILLVDDVITTGATIEACGSTLLKVKDLTLSIATLCFSSGN